MIVHANIGCIVTFNQPIDVEFWYPKLAAGTAQLQ